MRSVSTRARRAQRRAADLRESARALHTQAQQILRHGSGDGGRTLRVKVQMPADELLDAGEDIERLLVDCEALELSPAARDLLFALDEAISTGLQGPAGRSGATRRAP